MEDKTFFEDFRNFQDECPVIPLNAEASFPTKKGGLFKFKYADLASILKVVRPVLSKNNLLVYWQCNVDGSVTCVLSHKSGLLESTCLIKSNDDPKTQGAAITYAKRYSLVALLGIVAEEDKDAPSSEGKSKPKLTPKAMEQVKERIIDGNKNVTKECLLHFDLTEKQQEEIMNLELEYS